MTEFKDVEQSPYDQNSPILRKTASRGKSTDIFAGFTIDPEACRLAFERAVVDRMKESGFLEIEIRTECLTRCGDGYNDEVINAGWHYWQEGAKADTRLSDKTVDVISVAKSMLSIWDQWMNVEAIDRTTERQATDLLKAACFAGQAYEDMIASPLTADAASGVLLRIFLTAIIDTNSPELDPYRAKNRPQAATRTNEGTKPIVREQWILNDLEIGKSYESLHFGIVTYAGIDNFYGDQTHHFRTSWRTIHENRYISTDPDHPNNSLNHFLKPKTCRSPAQTGGDHGTE